jgi:tRNA G18 (ribose-2'-O)-methylase SpoU
VEEEIDIHVPRVGQRPGEHATIRVIKFKTLAGCESWLTDRNSLTVVGIEITDSSQSLLEVNFAALPGTGVVLVPGNEGAGLIERLRRCCHRFVYIPQYGNGTASLNVHTATSMALYYRALSRHPVSTHGPSASDLGN